MTDLIKRNDQIALLEACMLNNDNGTPMNLFTYPNCGPDLVEQGLVSKNGLITKAGRAALWYLGKGNDPTSSKSSETIKMPLKNG